jgi:hypothetical protein
MLEKLINNIMTEFNIIGKDKDIIITLINKVIPDCNNYHIEMRSSNILILEDNKNNNIKIIENNQQISIFKNNNLQGIINYLNNNWQLIIYDHDLIILFNLNSNQELPITMTVYQNELILLNISAQLMGTVLNNREYVEYRTKDHSMIRSVPYNGNNISNIFADLDAFYNGNISFRDSLIKRVGKSLKRKPK